MPARNIINHYHKFTWKAVIKKVFRDGAPPIDLIYSDSIM